MLFRTKEKDDEVSILVKKMQERIQKSIVSGFVDKFRVALLGDIELYSLF
jgi:hypothetical protein